MHIIKFPEANLLDPQKNPFCYAYSSNDPAKSPRVITKVLFSKDEAKFILSKRELYIIQNSGEQPPIFAYHSPFRPNGFVPIGLDSFIIKHFTWNDHSFVVLVSRLENNTKVKARYFSITMDGSWVKSGMLTHTLQSKGKGWLKAVLQEMVKELEKAKTEV
jgi:hypothetical protein